MENAALLGKYELVIILDAGLTNEQRDEVVKEVSQVVNKAEAKVINSQLWLDKCKFAFSIKKCSEGVYYLFNIEGAASSVKNIESLLKLNERLLRFMITRIE